MLQMLRDRILVKPIPRQASKVIDTVLYERPNIGEIVAVGPGKEIKGRRVPLEVKLGDRIRFGEFDFPKYEEAGVTYLIMQEADVAGLVVEQ